MEYSRDKDIHYIKAKEMILEYLQRNESITSEKIQELCGYTKQQARNVTDKMRKEKLIDLVGKSRASKYILR